ncbi:hypothetical protein EDC15_10421 [Acetobacter aceti NBRC 14818]|nr:hypothetical protein EDC15_10421 [Acetobacter aceti NBRC 14818]
MAKNCCKTDGCAPAKKGCCGLKKIVGVMIVAGIAGFLWKKFK